MLFGQFDARDPVLGEHAAIETIIEIDRDGFAIDLQQTGQMVDAIARAAASIARSDSIVPVKALRRRSKNASPSSRRIASRSATAMPATEFVMPLSALLNSTTVFRPPN